MSEPQVIILGAGLTGISASYHLGHDNCLVLEAKEHTGGHIHSKQVNGFTWDEGPHVSFTKHQYVKDLFAKSPADGFLEFKVFPTNYYKGHWIPHPAQSNLYAVPEPLRTQCFNDFLEKRKQSSEGFQADDYGQWLTEAFGETFANTFPYEYTKKYWTVPPHMLGTSWVGNRVFYPDVDVVKRGYEGVPEDSTHYITSIRYPKRGGYYSYASLMKEGMKVHLNRQVVRVDLEAQEVLCSDGSRYPYKALISTLPLPEFIACCGAPEEIQTAAGELSCSQLLIFNFEVAHPPTRTEQWMYVYDSDMYSTRINFTDLLSPGNAPEGKCGIQVEVYFSKYRPLDKPIEEIKDKVTQELVQMGLIRSEDQVAAVHSEWIPYANVIFDHPYEGAMDRVLGWLEGYGLKREEDDLLPMTDWEKKMEGDERLGRLVLAGRFGQWKYYWTDDCVLRGKLIAERVAISRKP
ncbi:MAG TPA: FAD-dependent oxidoreductase [Flavisolibacter sp.]|jgi:protoporphyrinogen oxidase